MKRLLTVPFMAISLVGAACGASGDGEQPAEGPAEDEGGSAASVASFGDLDTALCGWGDVTVDPAEAGAGADKLYIGVPNDRSSDIRPGLNKVMYDASVAYADWCNEQGGIGGLEIEVVDLDAGPFDVEAVMTEARTGVFALVGGGLAQDQLQFSGKPASDFPSGG